MNDIESLRGELTSVMAELRSGVLKPGEAKELTNAAGKIVQTLKVQCEYAKLRGEKPEIAFMETEKQAG